MSASISRSEPAPPAELCEQTAAGRLTPTAVYAAAVVIMRRLFDDLRCGKHALPPRFKRVAQRLVDLSMTDATTLITIALSHGAERDDARRAVDTAVLSLAVARELTTDAIMLSRIAMAALLLDANQPQSSGDPTNTAIAQTELWQIDDVSTARAVMAYEAQWLVKHASLGSLYRGQHLPTTQARLIAAARAFINSFTRATRNARPSIDQLISRYMDEVCDEDDAQARQILLTKLGLFPRGTLVELSTGELALVLKSHDDPALFRRPRVRVIFDAAGGSILDVREVDLAEEPRSGEPTRHIRTIRASAEDPSTAQLRAYVEEPTIESTPTDSLGEVSSINAPLRPIVPPTIPPPSTRAHWSASAQKLGTISRSGALPSSAKPDSVRQPRAPLDLLSLLEPEPMTAADPPPPLDRPKASTPTAEGTLARTPLLNLLVYMLDQRLTGTVLFTVPDGVVHALYFHDGAPAKIRLGTMFATLDRVLLEMGLLNEETLRTTLVEISKKRILHGRYLVMKGLLSSDAVISALRHQLFRKLMHLFEMPSETRYAYYESENLITSYGGPELTPCAPLATILAGIRLRGDDPALDTTLLRIAGRPLALHIDAEIKRFYFQRDEQAVIDLLRARKLTLEELQRSGVAEPRVVRLVIYALTITRHLDFGAAGRPPVGIGRAPIPHFTPDPIPSSRVGSSPSIGYATPQSDMATRVARAPIMARPTTRIPRVMIPSGTPEPRSVQSKSAPSALNQQSSSDDDANRRAAADTSPRMAKVDPDKFPPLSRPTTRIQRVTAPSPGNKANEEREEEATPSSRVSPPSSAAPSQQKPPSSSSGFNAQIASRRDEPSPPTLRPDIEARRTQIDQRAETIEQQDHFQALGVARDASADQIRTAYFALAKEWHPDRLPADLLEHKAKVARVFARISQAYQTLSDEEKRRAYELSLAGGGGAAQDEAKVERAVNAALEFQKAEVLLKKNDLVGAVTLARRAYEADPDQPEYLTLLVWIEAQRRGDPPLAQEGQKGQEGVTSAHLDDLIHKLDGVLQKEPRYERALFYRGILHKRAGHMEQAIADFRRVTELNPKNIDAAREVRIYEMRRRNAEAARPERPEGGGLFGKLFKR